jgi:hypothetical protein
VRVRLPHQLHVLLTMIKYGELINQYDSIGNIKNV